MMGRFNFRLVERRYQVNITRYNVRQFLSPRMQKVIKNKRTKIGLIPDAKLHFPRSRDQKRGKESTD